MLYLLIILIPWSICKVSHYSPCFKVYFVWYKYCYLGFFFHFHLHEILFPSPPLCVSLDLKWVTCRLHIYGSCFCIHSRSIHSATVYLLIGIFNPFTFKVIIDRYIRFAILLVIFGCFCNCFFFLTPFFAPVSCDLMTIFSVMFGLFLFCVCVCVYYRFLACGYQAHLYICDYFKLLASLVQVHFNNPEFLFPPYTFTVFDIIFYIFLFVYPLTTCHGCRRFYYFCLLTFLLALEVVDLLALLYIYLYQWDFTVHSFIFLVVAYSYCLEKTL